MEQSKMTNPLVGLGFRLSKRVAIAIELHSAKVYIGIDWINNDRIQGIGVWFGPICVSLYWKYN